MFSLNDKMIVDKSIGLSCLYFENRIVNSFNESELKLFTEVGLFDAIEDFTRDIIDGITDLINKIKEKLHRLFTVFRTRFNIDKINFETNKTMLQEVKVNANEYHDETKIRKIYAKILNSYTKSAKELYKVYPNQERMDVINLKNKISVDALNKELDRATTEYKEHLRRAAKHYKDAEFINTLEADVKHAITDIKSTLDKGYSDRDKYGYYNEKKNEKDEPNSSKKKQISICQKFQREIAKLGEKCSKFYSDNRTAILVAMSTVLSATAIGVNVYAAKEKKRLKKTVSEQRALIRKLRS